MTPKHTFDFTRQQYEELAFELEYPGTSIDTLCGIAWFDNVYSDEIVNEAINYLIEYEEALRIRICQTPDGYKQYAVPYQPATIPVADYGDITQAAMRENFTRLAQKPLFKLDTPLWEFQIFHYGKKMGVMYLIHHLIADAMTLSTLGRKVVQLADQIAHEAFIDLPYHYFSDIVAKEQSAYKSDKYTKDIAYWQNVYQTSPDLARINPESPDSDNPTANRLRYIITGEAAGKINKACKQFKVSPPIPFISALLIYLAKMNPTLNRIDIGQNLLGRHTREERDMLGMFSIELPLCVEINVDSTIEELYKAVIHKNLQSYRHSLCLHDEILEMVQTMHPETTAIRDVEFSYQPCADMKHNHFYGEWISALAAETSLELSVSNINSMDEFNITFDYRTEIFTPAEAEAALHKIISILKQIIANPALKISEITI